MFLYCETIWSVSANNMLFIIQKHSGSFRYGFVIT